MIWKVAHVLCSWSDAADDLGGSRSQSQRSAHQGARWGLCVSLLADIVLINDALTANALAAAVLADDAFAALAAAVLADDALLMMV